MPMPVVNLAGQTFGRLTVIQRVANLPGNKQARWLCACVCGKRCGVGGAELRRGHTRSCGCVQREAHLIHGHAARPGVTAEYRAWRGMLTRCYNPRTRSFGNYGGRGIQVFDGWRRNFAAFLAAVGPKPSPNHSLDRWPNNDGNYEPGNVRWASRSEQNLNRRPF